MTGKFSKNTTKESNDMKRIGNVYSKIYDIENLKLAHKKARKGKIWYREVEMVDKDIEKYLTQLQQSLIDKTYSTSNYSKFVKIDKGKEREIYKLPYYPDRICQWAIMLELENMFVSNFVKGTYASIPNRGVHKALTDLSESLKNTSEVQYCLKFDIKKFFPSIDKSILKKLLRKKIKDKELLWLLDEIIDSHNKGLPIGNYLSQYLANFYLSYFDHWCKETKGCKHYFRYMDDVVVLHHNKHFLHELREEIETYLEQDLKLRLKSNYQVFPTFNRGIDFVGYRHFGNYVLLRKSTSNNLKRKLTKIKLNKNPLSLNEFCTINSYRGWIKWGNCHNLSTKYIEPLKSKIEEYKRRKQYESSINSKT